MDGSRGGGGYSDIFIHVYVDSDHCSGFKILNFKIFAGFHFSYPMKIKYFGLTKTKLLYFHRIFENGVGDGVQANPSGSPTVHSIYLGPELQCLLKVKEDLKGKFALFLSAFIIELTVW